MPRRMRPCEQGHRPRSVRSCRGTAAAPKPGADPRLGSASRPKRPVASRHADRPSVGPLRNPVGLPCSPSHGAGRARDASVICSHRSTLPSQEKRPCQTATNSASSATSINAASSPTRSGSATRGSAPASALNQFRRSLSDRWLGGVCGGIGQITGTPSWVWRLVFTLGAVFAGCGLALYILLWILVPQEQLYLPAPSDSGSAG